MAEFNPYAAPKADVTAKGRAVISDPTGRGLWRDGATLVMRKTALLPDECVKCAQPAEGRRLKRNLSWHPQGYFLLVLISPLIYIIVALIVRKTAKIEVGLCERHRARRRNGLLIGWGVVLLGIALFVLSIGAMPDATGPLFVAGIVAFVGGLVVVAIVSQTVVTKKIDNEYVWLNKVDERVLIGLPDWVGGS